MHMNPRALAIMIFLTVVCVSIAIAFPAYLWIPLSVFGLYLIYALI